ncbi:kinesin-related protein 2 isoform X3 [Hydra vulgaris]|uniref:Kinesin-related protein 2 isoform X3 n=1 Tax=Hydra vulgaris TaxID=6087 RepID=A0ABM4DDU0_HYDVU
MQAAKILKKKNRTVSPLVEQDEETELKAISPPPKETDFAWSESTEHDQVNSSAGLETNELSTSFQLSSGSPVKNGEDASSRSSTPSSATGFLKRIKKNAVAPYNEETSFNAADNKIFEGDNKPSDVSVVEAWGNDSIETSDPNTQLFNQSTSTPSYRPESVSSFTSKGKRTAKVSPLSENENQVDAIFKDLPSNELKEKETSIVPTNNTFKQKSSMISSEIEKASDTKVVKTEVSPQTLNNHEVSSLVSVEAVLAPPQISGEQEAYIPISYAKQCIQKVVDDMKKMKENHYVVVEKIQHHYKLIEEDTQVQFNDYLNKLRNEYSQKVATFKQVLESHNAEFKERENFYEQAIKSLRDKNRYLIVEKRNFLSKFKDSNALKEREKTQLLADLTTMLDDKHKEYVKLYEKYKIEAKETEKFQIENNCLKNELRLLKSKLNTNETENKRIIEELSLTQKENNNNKLQIDINKKDVEQVVEEKIRLLEEIKKLQGNLEDKEKNISSKDEELKLRYNGFEEEKKLTIHDFEEKNQILEQKIKEQNEAIKEMEKQILSLQKQHSVLTEAASKQPTEIISETASKQPTEVINEVALKSIEVVNEVPLNQSIEIHNEEKQREKIDILQQQSVVGSTDESRINNLLNEIESLKKTINALQSEKLNVNPPLTENADKLINEIEVLKKSLEQSMQNTVDLEKEHNMAIESYKKQIHRADKKLQKLQQEKNSIEQLKNDVESQLKVTKEMTNNELSIKNDLIQELKKEIDILNEEKVSKLPVKAKAEIQLLQAKLKEIGNQLEEKNKQSVDENSKQLDFTEKINNLNLIIDELKKKQAELPKLYENERKYKELKKKYKALEEKKTVIKTVPTKDSTIDSPDKNDTEKEDLKKKIEVLEKMLENSQNDVSKKDSKVENKVDSKANVKLEKANEMLKEKLESFKKSAQVDADKIKELEKAVKDAKAAANDKNSKKQEKALKDLQAKMELEQKRANKNKEDLDKEKEENNNLKKEIENLENAILKEKAEIAKLAVAAKEGVEAIEKVSELSKSNKLLIEENKTLVENFNSERVLRKKYYNIVEDMKGKIRVYARARPLSRSELERGNYDITQSPDEYSIIIQTPRGPKDFQYDAVFPPGTPQEKVFEDTNNLIQSAVDGYNVCIFAYGQTGSGKTFTMIGDKEQKFPGIAPRSFQAIYALINENKKKFSFKTYMYMLELYRDNLIDLFSTTRDPDKLDIKKDKKGMVVVSGAIVKEAFSAEELMDIFEKGSSARHVASTKMNSESSRSHLILSIIIESTNLTSGNVTNGKLSLVDLAGSERAAKTGATPEQLKEAQSINKSLSALGDVISALSSDQAFIPYRNNKLTLLMQDSLGGNAKTLMFVNISPADYNSDETITSLTYASRVKLITNDASKNSESKEIARLKNIISKLKKGEQVEEDAE